MEEAEDNKSELSDKIENLSQKDQGELNEASLLNNQDTMSFDSKFIQAMILNVQDVHSGKHLIEHLHNNFQYMIQTSSSVPNSTIAKQLGELVRQIKQKIQDLEEDQEQRKSLTNEAIQAYVQELSELKQTTFNGAYALYLFGFDLISKEDVTYSNEIAKSLVSLTYYFKEDSKYYVRKTKQCFQLISSLKDFSAEKFKELLQTLNNTQYTYRSYLAKHTNDQTLMSELSEKFKDLLLNDKALFNHRYFIFFIPFLKSLEESEFINLILPQIDFMLKRTGALIKNISQTLSYTSFKVSSIENLKLMSEEIFSDSLLLKEDMCQDIMEYFSFLTKKLGQVELIKYLVNDFLTKKFTDTKHSSFTIPQRQNLIKYVACVLENIKCDIEIKDFIMSTTLVFLEHFFQNKDEGMGKDVYNSLVKITIYNKKVGFINEPLKKLISKTGNHWQVNYINKLLLSKKATETQEIANICQTQFKKMLYESNFKSAVNYSDILSLIAFFCIAFNKSQDRAYLQIILDNDNVKEYITTNKGYVNQQVYFGKQPSTNDIKFHSIIIETLMISNSSNQSFSDKTLRNTLSEYLLNTNYKFREQYTYNCYEKVCQQTNDSIRMSLLQSIQLKIIELSGREIVLSREDSSFKVSMQIQYRVKSILKFIFQARQTELTKEDFLLILQVICHPYLCTREKDLHLFSSKLDLTFKDKSQPFSYYFEQYAQDLTKYALIERSGILNHNDTLSLLASNILVLLGHYGQFQTFIGDLTKILNYKPLELTGKLLQLFEFEFNRIPHYDLMFYSEITKDILNVFNQKDDSFVKSELPISQSHSTDGAEEEKSSSQAPTSNIDPAKLLAQQMKKQAAAKKGTKGKGKAPQKKDVQKEKKPSQTTQEEVKTVDKEQRNKNDRLQIVTYIMEIQRIKGNQISRVLDIIKRINKSKNAPRYSYLDLTLIHHLQALIKLLHFPASNFSTHLFLNSLFEADKHTPFFKVKNQIVNSLVALSQNKVSQKNQREYQQIFKHFERSADYQEMDKGYLQLILMMTNAVLRDMSVNLSVKEQALQVTSSILENNVKVLNIDLVRVTINMMKSSYSNNNIGNYLNKLFKRINQEELALMLQRLFEYEPIPRYNLLQQLLEYDSPLFCPVWLCTQIWILQFDEEHTNKILARKLWNKYGMALRREVIELQKEKEAKNIFHYLRSSNTNIFDASIKASVATIELFQSRLELIVDDLIEFYDQELQIIDNMVASNVIPAQHQDPTLSNNPESQRQLILDDRTNRIAVSLILQKSANFLQVPTFKKIFEFLITKGCQDSSDIVSKQSMEAALHIIQVKGPDYSDDILKILEKFINESKKYSEQCKNQAIVMIGSLSTYLDKTNQKKLIGTFEKMIELLQSPSELIRQSICKCIPQLAKYFETQSKKILEDHIKYLRESKEEKQIRASAYTIAGIMKGLGMQASKEFDLFNIVQKEFFANKADPERKVAGLYLYECMSFSMGKAFEIHILQILPHILGCISDQKEMVRKAANQTNKAIMSRFSNHAIKSTLPLFLKGLEVDNWRSKLASVDALGNMAYCAPKQISTYLPQIVKGIREVLNDTHEKVHASALLAIQNIGSVIKCPEIADILDVLIKALSNPNLFLKSALKTLIDTSFVHSIDAPSLSLLIPILDNGLMMHDNESKQLASKLMGNICDLTSNPEDLLPYMKILMPAIKNSLFDSIPEIRASAAKALGSLSKGLGLNNSQDMLQWLRQVLHQRNISNSERTGAAQGFAEIISGHGVQFFELIVKSEIMHKYIDADNEVRESYRTVLVFLPTSFDQFERYLPLLLPLMIEGISDDIEDIRKISTRNVKICIKQFGKRAPNQLVMPIMRMMFDTDFKVRQSSSILMYQLVKELENDIIKSQPKYITVETKQEILSSMFILKYDTIERVSIQASQIWKNIIDNQLKVLRQVIQVLIKIVFRLIQQESLELSEMGLNCLRGLVEKFGEQIVNKSIDIFEVYLERATETAQVIGISKALFNMVEAAPQKILHDIRNKVIGIIDQNSYHEHEEVRDLAGKIFLTIFQKIYEVPYITHTLDVHFLKKLHYLITQGKIIEGERLQHTLKRILDQQEHLKLGDKLLALCEVQIHETPFTIAQAKIIKTVAPQVAHLIYKKKFYNSVLTSLLSELEEDMITDQGRISSVLNALNELVSHVPENDIVTLNETITNFYVMCKKKYRLGFYVDMIAYYCRQSKVSYESYATEYLKNVLELINENDNKLLDSVIHCLNSIFDGLQKESQFQLVPFVRQVIEQLALQPIGLKGLYKKKVEFLKLLEKPLGVKCLVNVLQNSIMHGSIEIRIDSATCFKYLIEFAKPDAIKADIIKICGALIRVVNDKFPPELKIQIFLALKLILIKASLAVKAMVPQLQTTFLKAFNDTQATVEARKIVAEDLILLTKITPKSDPIVKELTSLLDGEKLEREARIEVSEALALIIKEEGKKIQQTMLIQIQQSLLVIFEQKKSFYNEKTLASCAVALAFLSSYLPDSDKLQDSYFTQFDELGYPSISIGMKLGVIINSKGTPQFDTKISELREYLLATLKSQGAGVEEFDKKPLKENLQADNGTLYGVFDVLGYIGDIYVRRFFLGDDQLFKIWYDVVNKIEIFKTLVECDDMDNEQTFKQVQNYLSSIPIKLNKAEKLEPELAQTIKEGLKFIQQFYLDFDSKADAKEPLLNLLMLNMNGYQDVNDAKILIPLTKDRVRDQCNSDVFSQIVDGDIRMMAQDVIFFGMNQS